PGRVRSIVESQWQFFRLDKLVGNLFYEGGRFSKIFKVKLDPGFGWFFNSFRHTFPILGINPSKISFFEILFVNKKQYPSSLTANSSTSGVTRSFRSDVSNFVGSDNKIGLKDGRATQDSRREHKPESVIRNSVVGQFWRSNYCAATLGFLTS